MRRRPRIVLALSFAATVWPLGAAGQWISPPGTGWAKLEISHHDTRKTYDSRGAITSIFALGHSVTTTVSATVNVGLTWGVDVRAYLPIHSLRFDDAAGERARLGLGDPRLSIAIGPHVLGLRPVPIVVRAGVKLPGSDFPVNAEVIPLSEGQIDYEFQVEVGHSFYPLPLYVTAMTGYRFRTLDDDSGRRPGDEFLTFFAAGGSIGRFTWKIALETLHGLTPIIQRVPVRNARRKMIQVLPTAGIPVLGGIIEFGARIPAHGRNLPGGASLTAGYFLKFG